MINDNDDLAEDRKQAQKLVQEVFDNPSYLVTMHHIVEFNNAANNVIGAKIEDREIMGWVIKIDPPLDFD